MTAYPIARIERSQRAVWSLMTSLCSVVGRTLECECALINLVGAVTDGYVYSTTVGRRVEVD